MDEDIEEIPLITKKSIFYNDEAFTSSSLKSNLKKIDR